MTEVAPRCPFCANVVKVQATFWSRVGLKAARAACATCQREWEARDAQTMGASYHQWAEQFRVHLKEAVALAPILSEGAMNRALGHPHKDYTRLMSSLDELIHTCLRHQHVPLLEMAKGREASLEVVHLRDEASHTIETVAILGTSASESGAKEWQQVVARTGAWQFVVYNHPATTGAEPRVKRAVHNKVQASKIATNGKTVAALQASRAPAAQVKHR